MIQWEAVKENFQPDGSLRDIYITPANLDDWEALYALIRNQPSIEYSEDGIVQQAPFTAKKVFAVRPVCNPMLRFHLGRILIVFHFFSEDEVECDINPLEITSQSDLDKLLEFVAQLGDTTCKRVVITPENGQNDPFIGYTPENKKFEIYKARKCF